MAHRSRPDPELLQVVNDRLEHLLADGRPRRARGSVSSPVPLGSSGRSPEPSPAQPGPSEPGPVEPGPADWPDDEVEPSIELPPMRRFSRRHLGVVAVLLVVALVCAGWALFRARPVAVASSGYPVPTVSTPATAAAATPEPADRAGAAEMVVHVLGGVRRPGLVRLPSGARVQDAIDAAGGLTRSADPDDLNLAQPLADGQQIVIGTERHPDGEVREAGGADAEPGGAPSRMDLNRATPAQLEELPGVGPVTAANIVAWRQQHQRFTRVEELQEVDGIGPKTYAQIAPHVRV
ncbi:MAG TPA: helix-hairpin-helix domain-containing protein [Propionibacteriaceae bacterium]|nr:helix-hairpin-helix domain-containing protein [Propionibacteriaceae bacterium]